MSNDYYKILDVSKTADEKTIKAAYRKLALQFHPDINPDNLDAGEKFREIGAAYEVLSDPAKRAEYDESLKPGRRPDPNQAGSGTRNQSGTGSGFGKPGGFDAVYESMFGSAPPPRKSAAAKTTTKSTAQAPVQYIDVTLEEAFKGATRLHKVILDGRCVECRGTGRSTARQNGFDLNTRCPVCLGSGKRHGEEDVEVKIPAGIGDGAKLRLRGRGPIGEDGIAGDLYLTVRLQKHPVFERDGRDLIIEAPIPYTIAGLGGKISVDTLSGPKKIRIPAGVQGGQKTCIAGQGLPAIGSNPAGDLFVRLKITMPKDLNAEEKELLRKLAAIRQDPVE